ncbi:uncharacterized protein E0L32_002580 [Thyridium curvatum]|uniref:Aminoglycoside phosphotransferase domain-containing protein n=1 Tax=Thyridium curvatum TaxID=1093900 RepID=A0A507BGV0_9PEZI|nr:uncharacterized protein E0L32_002580 [Thyridium curvatum]TPX18723.1 hypothetical protein E0L32_002580 [Thyridium curvatum]
MDNFTTWKGVVYLSAEDDTTAQQICNVIDTADFQYLEEFALAKRIEHEKQLDARKILAGVTCTTTTDDLTWGSTHVVFKLVFSDGKIWVARVPYTPLNGTKLHQYLVEMTTEKAALETLRRRTFIPVPQIFGQDLAVINGSRFGFPFTLMSWLPGSTLSGAVATHVPETHLLHIAKQMAHILSQLQNVIFDEPGRLWCGRRPSDPPMVIPVILHANSAPFPPKNSVDWFSIATGIEVKMSTDEEDENDEEDEEDDIEEPYHPFDPKGLLLASLIGDRVHGPFPLCHMELHHQNILFDDECNITGVLGWRHAEAVPLERLAICQEYLHSPGDRNDDIVLLFREMTRSCLQETDDEEKHSWEWMGVEDPLPRLASYFASPRAEQLGSLLQSS